MDFQELKKQHETEASNFSKGKIYYVFGSTETENNKQVERVRLRTKPSN